MNYGQDNRLRVKRIVDFGAYLTDGENDVLLPKKYAPEGLKVGDDVDVFVYFDSEDRPIATTRRPKAKVGDVARLTVREINKFGAFLDWGLEKDLFVPYREMTDKKMTPNHSYVVKILFDPTSCRIVATNRFDRIARKNPPKDIAADQEMRLVVYDKSHLGFKVLADGRHAGILYHNEVFQPLEVGAEVTGYVARVRDDGKIDFRLRPSGQDGVLGGRERVLAELERAGGFLPFNTKTDDQKIKGRFQMSKRVFKQAIGNLYKERRITVGDDGIRLLPPS